MKYLFTALFSFAFLLSSSQNASVKGHIFQPTGEKVYLQQIIEEDGKRKLLVVDTSSIDEGAFALEARLDSTQLFRIHDGNEMTQVILSPGDELEVTFHTSFFDETMAYSGKGSKKNEFAANYYLAKEVKEKEMYDLMNDEIEKEKPDTTRVYEKVDEVYSSLKMLLNDYYGEYPELLPLFENEMEQAELLQKRQRKSFKRWHKFSQVVEEVKGETIFDFQGTNPDDEEVVISDYKGKPVLIDFWATWCGPCKKEIPYLQEIEKQYGERVYIVGASVWDKKDPWKKMVSELGFENNMFIPKGKDEELKKRYMLTSIPRYILLDENLTIVNANASRPSSGELQAELDAVLENKD